LLAPFIPPVLCHFLTARCATGELFFIGSAAGAAIMPQSMHDGRSSMKVTIPGSIYAGLVSSACLAEVGHLLERENLSSGQLRFTTNVAEAVRHGEIQFIAVGTPPNEDGYADLQYVQAGAHVHAFDPEAMSETQMRPGIGTSVSITLGHKH